MGSLRFDPDRFVTQLPRAYYADDLDLAPAEGVWNFEANGLDVSGEYVLRLELDPTVHAARLSLDRRTFADLPIQDGVAETRVAINNRLLSFDLDVDASDPTARPLESVNLLDLSGIDAEPAEYDLYTRDIRLGQRPLLTDWDTSRRRIMDEQFDLGELVRMRDELVDWTAGRQVLDPDDPHHGAIYSEEDKYSFTDAIFAACAFMRRFCRTSDHEWLDRATCARDYAFRGQYRDTGKPGKDGAWASMGIIDDPRGKDFRRITDPWAQASGVDTDIICVVTSKLHGMGLAFTDEQLEQLRASIAWQVANRTERIWFAHHEDGQTHCLNMVGLSSAAIFGVHRVLQETTGNGVDQAIQDDAVDAVRMLVSAQEAIGVYPYLLGDILRGGFYNVGNLPDNGMTLYHLMHTLRNPTCPLELADLREPMRRSGLWYLLMSRWLDDHLVLDFRDAPDYLRGVAFGNFTWCRVTMIDVVSQIWDAIGNTDFWRQFVRAHVRTIRQCYWNHDHPDTVPIKASVVPVRLVSWVQQAQWASLVFDNLAVRFGLVDSVDPSMRDCLSNH